MATSASSDVTSSASAEPLCGVSRLLGRSLLSLAQTGRSEEASRLAAEAWVLLREVAPVEAARLAGLLHVLAGSGRAIGADPDREVDAAPDLDVRDDPPARRHRRIFEAFAELSPGAAYILVNDHDPKPLYYQFAAEHPGEFEWDALEEGPEVWRVRIGRSQAGSQPATSPTASVPLLVVAGPQGAAPVDPAESVERRLDRWLADTFPASDPLPGPSVLGGPTRRQVVTSHPVVPGPRVVGRGTDDD